MSELKPCPICKKTPSGAYKYGYECAGAKRDLWGLTHSCNDIFVQTHGYSEQEAIDAWNRRVKGAEIDQFKEDTDG